MQEDLQRIIGQNNLNMGGNQEVINALNVPEMIIPSGLQQPLQIEQPAGI